MIPAIESLNENFEELEEWCDEHEDRVPEHELPSALVLTVDPREKPNARARICGDVDVLVQGLLVAARGNEAFRTALVNALPAFYRLAK